MVIYFPFKKEIYDMIIIPIQFNICFNNIELHYHNKKSEDLNPVPEVLTSDWGVIFKDFIESSRDKCIIIDLGGIKVDEKVFNTWKDISDISLIYINCDELLIHSIKKAYGEELIELRKTDGIYCNVYGSQFYTNNNLEANFINEVKTYFTDECAKRLALDGKDNVIKKNNSSNIFASFYIDIKKLFSRNKNMNVFLFGLYKKIEMLKEYDYFVVVSSNGAIMANILSYLFKKEVLYLLNLGPTIALSNRDLRSKIKTNAKYLYVFDFLCLGNELKTLDMLLKINGAQLVYGIGVAQLLPSERYERNGYKIDSLVKLEDYKDSFKYTISLYEEIKE